MSEPRIPDLNTIIQTGVNPKTGLPLKMGICDCQLKDNIRKQLRVLDEQNAINRYKWYNLPSGLSGQLLERILYYRGQGAFFFMKENNQFYFLPYTLSGSIDVYGRYMGITPLQFAGGTTSNEKGKERPWITGLTKKPVYEVKTEIDLNDFENDCVLLSDYSKQLGEMILPRQSIQDPLLDAMSEAIPLARTSLIANSGVRGMRVQTEDDADQVAIASSAIYKNAMDGRPFVPIVGKTEFQDLTNGTALKSEEYLLYLQALDNYRLSLYGLDSGGLFQKKSHMLEAEQNMNAGHARLAYQDGLTIRQNFCDIVNSIWGLGIWCEPAEAVLEMDTDGDGQAVDKQDQSGQVVGEQPQMKEE